MQKRAGVDSQHGQSGEHPMFCSTFMSCKYPLSIVVVELSAAAAEARAGIGAGMDSKESDRGSRCIDEPRV